MRVQAIEPVHPLLRRSDGSVIEYLPAHPLVGAVSAPIALGAAARVVACSESLATGRRFNLAVAIDHYERDGTVFGRSLAEATFHRFADYNWDTTKGCPSFVDEPEGNGMQREPRALPDAHSYARNISRWLQQ